MKTRAGASAKMAPDSGRVEDRARCSRRAVRGARQIRSSAPALSLAASPRSSQAPRAKLALRLAESRPPRTYKAPFGGRHHHLDRICLELPDGPERTSAGTPGAVRSIAGKRCFLPRRLTVISFIPSALGGLPAILSPHRLILNSSHAPGGA